MMKKIAVLFVCIIMSMGVFSQNVLNNMSKFDSFMNGKFLMDNDFWKGVEGTPFLDSTFKAGSVWVGSTVYKEVLLRYNAYVDRVEFKTTNDIKHFDASKLDLKEIVFGNMVFVFTTYMAMDNYKNGYMELLNRGKYKLLRRFRVELKEAKGSNGYSEARKAHFTKPRELYYLKMGDKSAIPIRRVKDVFKELDKAGVKIPSHGKLKRWDDIAELLGQIKE